MIRNILLSVMLAAFAMQANAAPASPKDSLNAFYAALAAGEKAKALALLAPKVAIYESGYVESSRDEYAQHHLGGDIDFAKTSKRKVIKHSEKIAGDVAIIWEETETTGKAGALPVHSFGTETAVLEKSGDKWLIAHVHWSSRKEN